MCWDGAGSGELSRKPDLLFQRDGRMVALGDRGFDPSTTTSVPIRPRFDHVVRDLNGGPVGSDIIVLVRHGRALFLPWTRSAARQAKKTPPSPLLASRASFTICLAPRFPTLNPKAEHPGSRGGWAPCAIDLPHGVRAFCDGCLLGA